MFTNTTTLNFHIVYEYSKCIKLFLKHFELLYIKISDLIYIETKDVLGCQNRISIDSQLYVLNKCLLVL